LEKSHVGGADMDKLDCESWESPREPTPVQIANKAAKEWRSKGKRVRLQRKFVRVSVSVVALHRPFSCFLPLVCGARIFLGPHRPLHGRGRTPISRLLAAAAAGLFSSEDIAHPMSHVNSKSSRHTSQEKSKTTN
jgi:hypothetical protein